MNLITDIIRQKRLILRDGRVPERIVVGRQMLELLRCETAFLMTSPYAHTSIEGEGPSFPPGCLGYIAGLPIYPGDRDELRVLAEDWEGYGQGDVRG